MKLAGVTRLVHLKSVASTQTEARRLAEAGAASGTLVWADRQTAGRGRLGRKWKPAEGGLYASWVLRPKVAPERLAELSLLCGEALAEALRGLGPKTAVKPPNDVLALCADGKARKLCGVLIEASGDASGLHWVVVGFGVNCGEAPPLARATGLKALTGRAEAPAAVLKAAMTRLFRAARAGHFL